MTSNIAGKLAEFVCSLRFSTLPEGAVRVARLSLMDSVGCALAGSTTVEGEIVRAFARENSCNGEATLIGDNHLAPMVWAAFANGTMMHSLELDDIVQEASLHPGGPVNSAALAAAEMVESSGKDLVTAIVAGYDVMIRVAMAFGQKTRALPLFHLTGICGGIGAAAAVSKLFGLDRDETCHAMAVAASIGAGVREYGDAMTKRMYPGKAAENGVTGALLARKGFTGPPNIIEGEGGFLKSHLRAGDELDLKHLTDDLGRKFRIERNGFKLYACCSRVHTAIDAALEIAKNPNFNLADVEEVVVKISRKGAAATVTESDEMYEPSTKIAAQFSLPYCVAVALADRAASLPQFSDNRRSDPKLLKLVRRVRPVYVKQFDRYIPEKLPVAVEVKMRDGKTLTADAEIARGNSLNPVSAEELQQKFSQLARTVLEKNQTRKLSVMLSHIDQVGNVRELSKLLRRIR